MGVSGSTSSWSKFDERGGRSGMMAALNNYLSTSKCILLLLASHVLSRQGYSVVDIMIQTMPSTYYSGAQVFSVGLDARAFGYRRLLKRSFAVSSRWQQSTGPSMATRQRASQSGNCYKVGRMLHGVRCGWATANRIHSSDHR